jgi:uncharacterized membrane protein SpoIIM required for sporulation
MLNGSELKGTYRIINNHTAVSPYQVPRRNLKLNIFIIHVCINLCMPQFLVYALLKGYAVSVVAEHRTESKIQPSWS